MLCGNLDGRGVGDSMDTRIYMAESLPCSPETAATSLIGYTLIQNKKFKVKKKKKTPEILLVYFPPIKKKKIDAVYILAIGL